MDAWGDGGLVPHLQLNPGTLGAIDTPKTHEKRRQGHQGRRRQEGLLMADPKAGLYINIKRKRDRIKAGSGESMRKPGAKGAPTAAAFKKAAKTAKKK